MNLEIRRRDHLINGSTVDDVSTETHKLSSFESCHTALTHALLSCCSGSRLEGECHTMSE